MSIERFLGLYNYWIVIFLMMTGFYIVISRGNLIRSIIGLNIFQTSVFLLYITMGKVRDGTAPIVPPAIAAAQAAVGHGEAGHGAEAGHAAAGHAAEAGQAVAAQAVHDMLAGGVDAVAQVEHPIYSNPIPSVLMLTAIVVGIATTAVALALVVRIREDYGTIEEDEILALDQKS